MSLNIGEINFGQNELGLYVPGELENLHGLQLPDIDDVSYKKCLNDINETADITSNPGVEMYIVNPEMMSKNVIIFWSTHFSSGSQNIGNMIELAARGATSPNTAIVYIAFPGNGGSEGFSHKEQSYRSKTGRFTIGDGSDKHPYSALDTIKKQVSVLAEKGVLDAENIYVSGDESGARLAAGGMLEIEKDRVKGSYFNGPSGISHEASYVTSMVSEDAKSRLKRRKKLSLEETKPGEIVDARIKQAHDELPNIYERPDHKLIIAKTYAMALPRARVNSKVFGGFDNLDNFSEHAAGQDYLAALRQHDSMQVFQFNLQSAIHSIDTAKQFGALLLNHVPADERTSARQVKLIIGQGSLDSHTDIPEERWGSEKYSFPSLLKLIGIAGGLIDGPQIAIPNLPNVAWAKQQRAS